MSKVEWFHIAIFQCSDVSTTKYGFIADFYEIIEKLIVKIKFYDFESSIIGLATEMIVDKAIIISIFF